MQMLVAGSRRGGNLCCIFAPEYISAPLAHLNFSQKQKTMKVPFHCLSFNYLFKVQKKEESLMSTSRNSNLLKGTKPLTRGREGEWDRVGSVYRGREASERWDYGNFNAKVLSIRRMIWGGRHLLTEPRAGSVRYFEGKHQNWRGWTGVRYLENILLIFSFDWKSNWRQ